MTFKEFVENWETMILVAKPEAIRKGYLLMVYLGAVWFKEYQRLSSIDYYDETDIDCFYNDSIIPNTLKHLEKVWINFPN